MWLACELADASHRVEFLNTTQDVMCLAGRYVPEGPLCVPAATTNGAIAAQLHWRGRHPVGWGGSVKDAQSSIPDCLLRLVYAVYCDLSKEVYLIACRWGCLLMSRS